MILSTPRLTLRPTRREDAPALFAVLGDSQAMKYWDRGPLPRLATVEAQLEDELAAMAAGGFFYWTVLKDDAAIGFIDLSHIDGEEAWTGFAFHHDQWGQGLAREALAAVIGNAFGAQRLTRLQARVQTGNLRAIRLLRSLGFQERGRLGDIARDGGIRACVRYSLSNPAPSDGGR